MTARVTTLKGLDAGAYYVEALPSYYLDSASPEVCGTAKAPHSSASPARLTTLRSWP